MTRLGQSTLSAEQRMEEARELLKVIASTPAEERDRKLRTKDKTFLAGEYRLAQNVNYAVSPSVLFWLRDIKDRLL